MKSKDIILIVMSVIILMLLVTVSQLDKVSNKSVKLVEDDLSIDTDINEYIKDAFMRGCTKYGTQDYCNCVIDYMLEHEGRNGVVDMSLKMMEDPNFNPKGLDEAVDYCVK